MRQSKKVNKENIYLAQVAKMGELPSEAALISNLRAFGADTHKKKMFCYTMHKPLLLLRQNTWTSKLCILTQRTFQCGGHWKWWFGCCDPRSNEHLLLCTGSPNLQAEDPHSVGCTHKCQIDTWNDRCGTWGKKHNNGLIIDCSVPVDHNLL